MDDHFKFRATLRTGEELRERVDNREKYLPETVEASVEELQSRGEEFSGEELTVIADDMQERRRQAVTATGFEGLFNRSDKLMQVADPDAPAFYSKGTIYVFSILFSVLFGSVLLAINVNETEKRPNMIWVVLYGLAFTLAEGIVASQVHAGTAFAVIGGIIGSTPLNYFFWRRYLGNATLYRKRPVWIPLIVGIAISAVLIYLIFAAEKIT